jgi:dolichol kinase
LFYGATSLLASCIATWAERECGYWHLDDNLMIPIAFGAVMQAGYLIAMIY